MGAAERCKRYRRRILDISQTVTCHVAPAFSCIEIVDCIYNELMNPQDVFIMSKGHGALAQYVVLEERKQLSLDEYCAGSLGAHPDLGGPIAASTGSLGHGLGMAVGMAYAERLKGDVHIYCLMSDGELQEGSTWEALQMAANLRIDNLMLFVDLNDFGGLQRISDAHPALYPVIQKLWAFGWQAYGVNGHNSEEIVRQSFRRPVTPTAIVCTTKKGKGVSYMEESFIRGDGIWHYKSPNPAEYAAAMLELE